jgi:hypothetical protein
VLLSYINILKTKVGTTLGREIRGLSVAHLRDFDKGFGQSESVSQSEI